MDEYEEEPRVHTIIDTTAFRAEAHPNSLTFRKLVRLTRGATFILHVPYVVWQEHMTQQTAAFEKDVKESLGGLNSLIRKLPDSEAKRNLDELSEKVRVETDRSKDAVIEYWDLWQKLSNVQIVPIKPHHTDSVFSSYFEGKPPFKSSKNRKDIPDAYIYEAIKDVSSDVGELIIVTADEALADACKTIDGTCLYRSIADMLESNTIKDIVRDETLFRYMETLSDRVIRNLKKYQKNVVDEIEGTMVGNKFNLNNISNLTGEVLALERLHSLEFDEIGIEYYSDGDIIVPFQAIVNFESYHLIDDDQYALLKTETEYALTLLDQGERFHTIQINHKTNLAGHILYKVSPLPHIESDPWDDTEFMNEIIEFIGNGTVSMVELDNINNGVFEISERWEEF